MIRARVGDNLLRIQREGGACGGDEVENGPEATIVYNIWIIDRRGVVCGEVTLTPREAEYPLAKELFEAAWGKARNTNEVLDDMIRALSVKG
jgi:hypothetical protein